MPHCEVLSVSTSLPGGSSILCALRSQRHKEVAHHVDTLLSSVAQVGGRPLLSKPSFRPSEILQRVYVGGFKDVTPDQRRTLLRPAGAARPAVRVYVCCCWAGGAGRGVDEETASVITKPAPRRALLQVVRITAGDTSALVDQYQCPLVTFLPDGTSDAEALVREATQWIESSVWLHRALSEGSHRTSIAAGGSPQIQEGVVVVMPEKDASIYELHLRIPIEDEDDFMIEGPVVDAVSPARGASSAHGRGFLSVFSGILSYLLSQSEMGSEPSPPSSDVSSILSTQHASVSQRRFGIVVYCAAGKSRSVTILAALLVRQVVDALVASFTSGCPEGFLTPLDSDEARQLSVHIVASAVAFIQQRRAAACPNGGFREALREFAYSRLVRSTPPKK